MDFRAPLQPVSRRIGASAALIVLTALVGSVAAPVEPALAKARKAPVVTSISPKKLTIREKLTVRGRHFRRGKGRNTVVFKRPGARPVFVRADISTAKLMKVTVPKRLTRSLAVRNGTPQFTRFRIRVLSHRFGRSFTSAALSPTIGPEKPPTPPAPAATAADGDCDSDGVRNGVDLDDDNDLLTDVIEAKLRTDSCNFDSDGDGAGDGYEFQSALDLNDDEFQEPNLSLPYPEKRPYPNALFADAHLDFDGDGLTLGEEHKLWRDTGDTAAGLSGLNYSDGLQYSVYVRGADGRRRGSLSAATYDKHQSFIAWATGAGYLDIVLADGRTYDLRDFDRSGSVSTSRDVETTITPEVFYRSELRYYDFDEDGRLSDDERDEDADGLTNYDEAHGRMLPKYWTGCYGREAGYPVPYAGTSLTDPDSDGDGVRDGADDQDHDDIPNLMEMSRNAASGRPIVHPCNDKDAVVSSSPTHGWVNPFNPCLPDRFSRTCSRHPPLGSSYAPFDAATPNYLVLN
jgi:hypothetical protein